MSLASIGYQQVEEIVKSWTKKYQYHISLNQSKQNQAKFKVEFSLPQPQKPVPPTTINVYFSCTKQENLKITFRFQKDSLIHYPNKTIRHQQIQKWIDDSLAKKLLVRQTVFYLGTSYESTRVKNQRQDNILREIPKPEVLQYVYIHPDLLSDQKRFIEIMQKSHDHQKIIESQLKKYFKQVDKDNIGVITQNQFLKLSKNIGIKLSPQQQKQLLKRADPQESGMIEYSNYKSVIYQFVEGIISKRQAEERLETISQQQIFTSILMMINDESQDIQEQIISKLKAKDEDQTGLSNISEVKNVLDEINKKFKEQNKLQPITVVELAQITKILTDNYGYKDIPYNKIHKHIIQFKIKQLSQGRVNSKMNNLQVYLKEIFSKFDTKKIGKVKLQNFEEALTKSQKIHLTKAQIYLLKSLLFIDVKGEINYVDNSKFLAQIIKKFYLNSSKKRIE